MKVYRVNRGSVSQLVIAPNVEGAIAAWRQNWIVTVLNVPNPRPEDERGIEPDSIELLGDAIH